MLKMHEEIEESFADNSYSTDKCDPDLCVEFNSNLCLGYNASKNGCTKLRSNERKTNTYYSHSEALIVAKNLQRLSTTEEALCTLKMWLENGDCNKQNADNFYALIQVVCIRVNYLQQMKVQLKKSCEDRISKRQSELLKYIKKFLAQFDTIKAIFNLAQGEKVQNLFSEAQINDIKKSREMIEKCEGKLLDELALCDKGNISKENFTSSCNLDRKGIYISSDKELQREIEKLKEEKLRISSQLAAVQEEKNRLQSQLAASNDEHKHPHISTVYTSNVSSFNFSIQKQAHLVAVISPFLYVQRDIGQTLADISSHLKYLGFLVSDQEVEDILVNNPSIFQASFCDNGTSVEKRWKFCGYAH